MKIDDHGTFVEIGDVVDEAVPRDEYVDEMLTMSLSQTEEIAPSELASPFDLFGVSILEIIGEIQVAPAPEHDSDDDSSSTSDSDPVDERVSPAVGDTEIVDFGTADQPRELRIGSDLSVDERDNLIQLLGAYLDVFAWSYEDMPSLDPSIVQHRLPLLPHARPVLMAPEDMEKTSFITEWGTYCYRVMPFGLKNAGATYQRAATTLFHDMMHRDVEIETDPKKCTFRVTFGKLLGYMVNERDIEVDPDKIRAILDMPAPRTEREVRGFWVDFILAPPTPGRPLLLYLSVSDVALGCMLAQLDDSGKDRAIYYLMHLISRLDSLRYLFDRPALVGRLMRWLVLLTEFDIHYVTQKSVRGSVVADHLASLPVSDGRAIDDDFSDEDVAVVTSLSGWRMYFDGATNHSGYGIGVLLISLHGDHIPDLFVWHSRIDILPRTTLVEYEACILGLETALELEIRQIEVFGDSNLVLRQIQGEWKTRDVKLRPYHAYLELLVGRFDDLRYTHLPRAQNQFADALATLASMIDIPIDATVRPLLIESRSAPAYYCLIEDTEIDDGLPWMLLLCLDRDSTDRVMREVHAGVCRPHMRGHMLARKIMRTGYFWLTIETNCYQFVQRCPKCSDTWRSHSRAALRAARTGFTMTIFPYGVLISSGIFSSKSSSGHEFILVAIDYFTKWVKVASYARLTSSGVASFIRSHIICRYGDPHESSAYKPQTNGAVEATNKNIKRILRRMVENFSGLVREAPICIVGLSDFFSHLYRSYTLLIGIQHGEEDGPHFQKAVKPRPLRIGDLVLKVIRGSIRDPRGKFRPNWSGPYFIKELTPEGAAWIVSLMMIDLVSPVFDLSYLWCHTGAYPISFGGYGSSRTCTIIITYWMLMRRGHDRYLTEP
ncbi:hypothetical protein CK203_094721 [Vitis vinifera]|uniref:RNase H type-1 domain-containing protein n=1 Tax=Vitis vinifera TaxID=29760 RepID=A0A438BWS5_VITVI|nr:hypothetical protein CK203_094721 [Vitis vinifera]